MQDQPRTAARARHPSSGDAPLLDAYSRAVVDIVDEVGPSATRIDMRRSDRTAGSTGGGVIVSSDSLVLTNSHAVQGSRRAIVTTVEGRRLEARPCSCPEGFGGSPPF